MATTKKVLVATPGFVSITVNWAQIQEHTRKVLPAGKAVLKWYLRCGEVGKTQEAVGPWDGFPYEVYEFVIPKLKPKTQYGITISYSVNHGPRYTGVDINDRVYWDDSSCKCDVVVETKAGHYWPTPQNFEDGKLWQVLHDRIAACKAKFNILLFGVPGAGKSSFINTLYSAFLSDKFDGTQAPKVVELARGQQEHVTMKIGTRQFLRGKSNKMTGPILWDTWGYDSKSYEYNQLDYLLSGNLMPGFPKDVKPDPDHEFFNMTPGLEDKMHAVIFIAPASEGFRNAPFYKDLKEFAKKATNRGLLPILILTKCDKLDSSLVAHPERIFYSEVVVAACQEAEQMSGIPFNQIFPLKPYTVEHERNIAVETMVLRAFDVAVERGTSFIQDMVREQDSDDDDSLIRQAAARLSLAKSKKASKSPGKKQPAKKEQPGEEEEAE